MNDLRIQLRDCLRDRVCFMGLGNIDYGDDGFGVRLAEELIRAGMRDVVVAGTTPERSMGRVADGSFDHLIFIDAVEFDGAPGSVIFLNSQEITARFLQISTHKISLGVLAKLAEAGGATRAWLLGVQPESIQIGQQVTPTVRTTLILLREMVLGVVRERKAPVPDGGGYRAERSCAEVNS